MGKQIHKNIFRLVIILIAIGLIVFTLCTEGKTIAKFFGVFGMSMLTLSMIVSFEKGSVDSSSKQPLSLPFKLLILNQVLIVSALVFVIMDSYKWVTVSVLALALISSIFILYKWKK